MLDRKNGKKVITILLVLSCIVSGIILAASPSNEIYRLDNTQQLDSLINTHIQNSLITQEQVQVSVINIDTIFTRKVYRLRVPSRFSKTMFHINLHKDLNRYEIKAPAKINFPSRDMHIYVYNKGTVLRTIRLTTDPSLDTLTTEQN
ncbi:MAG: hypothetical protein HUJ22_07785 [Gracilimonas sp.]|uniref:hypothetical protein n=1 Tax=Gracilimonas sp. TaxID=1974203 RepID=UPI0019BB70A5|nr:hypothetical protein [Gracilimonas sp.]MBD3616458.1 hypothetical protein [Gracilimonas sp.]